MSGKHWLASYGRHIPAEINPDAHSSVLSMLEIAMKRFADRPAFRCFDQTLTYADTDRLSRQFAAYLQGKLGVKKGDRIAVMLPNIPAFPLALLGIVRAGATQVNVNPLYTPRELEHQLNDAGVEIIVIFSGVSATLAEIIGKTQVKTGHQRGPGRRHQRIAPEPAGGRTPNQCRRILRRPRSRRGARLHTGCIERRRSALPAVHRRNHRALEGRRAVAPQPRRQHRTVQGLHGGRREPRTGRRGHGAAAVPHLRADGELHHLLLGRRRELACPQSARHEQLRRDPAQGALHRPHRSEYAVRRPADAPADRRGGFLQAARGDRRRRRGAAHDVGEMEGADRQAHPRRLRPFGNLAGPHPQSGDDEPASRRRWACRSRRPTSSCSTRGQGSGAR